MTTDVSPDGLVPYHPVHSPFYFRKNQKQIGYDSQGDRYWVVDDTYYAWDTPDDVISVLEHCRKSARGFRIELVYGDPVTGLAWADGVSNTGYIGRSTGQVKIPLLVWNSRSYGGPSILESHIVRIRMARGKYILYQHPHFHIQATWADTYLSKYPRLWKKYIQLERWLFNQLARCYGKAH